MERFHGHVGPWNVLGWRIGQAALRELGSGWGRHEIELICYCPPATPYTCLFDGLIAGTGNSPGRLDARLQEAFVMAQIHVAARRKDGSGPTLLFEPSLDYLRSISGKPHEELERLARDAAQRPESELFAVRRIA
ncbi:MAG: formylmethanofuran dehydrogenase subunit E family protein [Verrucomicrobia bacterium]|nr:formylmethanofuran dehydrogenase subunit E family protein [Verrucomicrobiota bacterium]